ncbi:chemotaxis protein CheA [Tsuneonella sp. SYSU-LHT278]|uniref:chemotaxis protein CheA n=1 Tax=Tsuneonella sediminis TaxID=3416089 RepID=UPI003F7AEA8A
MDDLLAEFLAETREMMEAIGGELVAWEAAPSDRTRLDAIFRFVHTVKGNCGFFDFPRLEALSHAAEDALAEVRAGQRSATPRLVTAVLGIVDRIGAMVDAIEAGAEMPAGSDEHLIAALRVGEDTDDGPAYEPCDTRAARSGGAQRTIRLPVSLLDDVMASVSDLVLARNHLALRVREAGSDSPIYAPFERLNGILDEVRQAVTRLRMQRIDHLYAAIPRLVRDLAAELGKQVMVDLEGGEVELDREMIEMIRDSLTHIIRNAIDHGIELPSARHAAGKREIGTILVSARQSGNRIMLAVSDDGRGIDGERLVAKAVAVGVLTAAEGESLSDDERRALIFEPGLSTADEVTSVSGRGVGMDAVRANIERVGGTIEVTSTPGEGTRILLSLPLTLSIVPSLTVSAGGELFALPQSYVEEIVHGRAGHIEIARAGDATLVTVRDRRIACVSLAGVLGMGGECDPQAATLVLIRLAGGDLFAIACDRVLDHQELVIKPLAPAVMASGLYAGSTLLDDGKPVLMLDIAGISRKSGLVGDVRGRIRSAASEELAEAVRACVKAMLFVGLDGRRRAVRLSLVRRFERVPAGAVDLGGERPQVVIGDRILTLAGIGESTLPDGQVSLLRLGDGQSEIAYVFARVIDTVDLPEEIVPSGRAGPVEGTVLIDGEPAELLDGHWLFAAHAAPAREARRMTCRIPAGDPWARSILAPLVESAGYAVVDESYAGAVDVAIASADDPFTDHPADSLITLSADPEATSPDGPLLYRYDRAGLLARLAALRTGRAA